MDSNQNLGEILQNIKNAIDSLNEKIDRQEERISKLEYKKETSKSFSSNDLSIAPPPPPPVKQEGTSEFIENQKNKVSSKFNKTNLEEVIGGNWFAKIGAVVLIIGVALFLKYAFDNDWIGETGRVVMGLIAGLALLFAGEKYIRKYFVYSQIISGAGLAILYLSIFSALDFYNLIPQSVAFLSMVFVTAIGIALSLRYKAVSLMVVALLGGFATPFLVSSGENNQIVLFSYILILDLAVLFVSTFKNWRALNVVSFLGTWLVSFAWFIEFYSKEQLVSTMIFFTAFFLVYSLSSLIYNLVEKEKSTGIEQVLTLLSAFAYFWAGYVILDRDFHFIMGFFAIVLAIYYLLWAYLVKVLTPQDRNLYGFLAFLTVGFITLAIPLQFKQNIITISWAIEAVLLLYIGLKTKQKEILVFSAFIYGITLARLIFIDADRNLSGETLSLFNKKFLSFLLVIVAFYLGAFLLKLMKGVLESWQIKLKFKSIFVIFIVIANLLSIYSVSQEISFYYSKQVNEINAERREAEKSMSHNPGMKTYPYSGLDNDYYEQIRNLRYKESISLSIFWMVYAVILLILGFMRRYKGVRVGGLLLLFVSIIKLFFIDLWSLGTLYRIISSISLGVLLLLISFYYQKNKDKIKEII